MPVGIGLGQRGIEGSGAVRRAAPRGFHPGALWLAAAAPVLATILVIARLAA